MSHAVPAPPPRFVPRFLRWLALAIACALPLSIVTFRELDAVSRSAEAAGIVAWAFVLAKFEGRLGANRSPTWRRSLTTGFAVWAAVQGAVACVAAADDGIVRILAFSLYALALVPVALIALLAWIALPFATALFEPFGPTSLVVAEFVAVLLLTFTCGIPNLMAGVYATNLIELVRARPVLRRPRAAGATPIERST